MRLLSLLRAGIGGFWGYVAAAGAVLVGLLVALAKAKKAGKDEVIAESAKKEVENVRKASEIERKVATTKPDAVRDRLRKYERD